MFKERKKGEAECAKTGREARREVRGVEIVGWKGGRARRVLVR